MPLCGIARAECKILARSLATMEAQRWQSMLVAEWSEILPLSTGGRLLRSSGARRRGWLVLERYLGSRIPVHTISTISGRWWAIAPWRLAFAVIDYCDVRITVIPFTVLLASISLHHFPVRLRRVLCRQHNPIRAGLLHNFIHLMRIANSASFSVPQCIVPIFLTSNAVPTTMTGIAGAAHMVFVRNSLVEVQYLRTTITEEQAPLGLSIESRKLSMLLWCGAQELRP